MFYRKYICRVKKKNVGICLCTDGLTYDYRIVGHAEEFMAYSVTARYQVLRLQAQIFTLVFAKYGNAL